MTADSEPYVMSPLEDLEAAYNQYCVDTPHEEAQASLDVLLDAVPGLIDELRAAREFMARWQAMPISDEYAITPAGSPSPDIDDEHVWTAEHLAEAELVSDRFTCQAWTRRVHCEAWRPLADNEPPF